MIRKVADFSDKIMRQTCGDHSVSMNILALDTSMGACSVALLRESGGATTMIAREARMARGHAEALMPMLEELMDGAKLDFSDLDLIAATLGPGSFTGVRVAIAAARGLSLATNAKLWGTDSLTVMARGVLANYTGGPFAIAVDAHRSMLYLGLFDGDGARLEGPLLVSPEHAAAKISRNLHAAFGSGAAILAAAARDIGLEIEASEPDLQPDASNLAVLALQANATLPTLRPLYLRPPDAKPQSASGVARR
jgi:tRNA threonylcarbamoyladenosine biosynthesis protein TsaB